MFFGWICRRESGLPFLFLRHLGSSPLNITFEFFKIFHFSSYLFPMVFTWSSLFYFLGDLKNIGKFVITLHSSNFQWLLPHSLDHSLPFYQSGPSSRGYPLISIQFFDVSFFLIFFPLMFPCVPSLLIASFFPFPSNYIDFLCLPRTRQTCIIIFWEEGIGLLDTWLPCKYRTFASTQEEGTINKLLIFSQCLRKIST